MVMVDSLCQGYHWSYKDVLSLTVPQLLMLNHASHVNSERMKAKYDVKNDTDTESANDFRGKPVEELNDDELSQYFKTFTTDFR